MNERERASERAPVAHPLSLPRRLSLPALSRRRLVLSPQDDDFVREHMNAQFPDALESAQRLSQDYQRVKSGIGAGRSMEEIQRA